MTERVRRTEQRRGRSPAALLIVLGAFVLGIGVGLSLAPGPSADLPPGAVGAAAIQPVDPPGDSPRGGWEAGWDAVGGGERPDDGRSRDARAPVRVAVPDIHVDAPVIDLALDEQQRLEVPATAHETGWWTGGSAAGEDGPLTIVGHYDDDSGPAVFHALRHLRPGATVEVERADGRAVHYRITRLEQHPKDAFPTEAVYGATGGPTIRLITCGGEFDRSDRSYLDNIIAFGRIMGPCEVAPTSRCFY